jgi:outer membrane protein TolC
LTREQALLQHQAVLADTALEVRLAFYDTLLAAQQIVVCEASLELLTKELEDTNRRHDAGTVPRFNVLRAEVELANAKPRLIRARNAHRIAKNNLANLLGYHIPKDIWEDIPLRLAGTLAVEKLEIGLPDALARAQQKRPELAALRKLAELRKEAVAQAKAGALPSVQAYAGYGARNSSFTSDLSQDISGWQTGVQMSWDLFDGRLTKGKVSQACAQHEKTQLEIDDVLRRIELEVRTAYSNLTEAGEVLESQKKVQEQAEEALRQARARAEAGTGTQLDVLGAQTALTEARTTQIQAARDYATARARLERAVAAYVPEESVPDKPSAETRAAR